MSRRWRFGGGPNHDVALHRAGIAVFRDFTFLAAGPASERVVRLQIDTFDGNGTWR